jgi:4-amino-4-deoxy-L-arabinose transferase-like glycosyltransferase
MPYIKQNTTNLFIILLLVSIVYFLVGTFYYPYVSFDCGYYLNIAKEIYNGKLYFTDIASSYTPLGIIIMGVPFLFDAAPSYGSHLAICILAIFSSGLILFQILKTFNSPLRLNILFSLLFIVISLNYDGNYILLEPFAVFFQLLSLRFYLKYKVASNRLIWLFFSGLILSLAFLTKQFSLFLLLPFIFDLMLNQEQGLKKTILLTIGLMLPLVFIFIFYNIARGVDLNHFLLFILGKGIALDIGNGTGLVDSINKTGIVNFILSTVFVFSVPFFLKNHSKPIKDKLFYILLPFSALSVLYFATYDHYFQFLAPYIIILFIYAFSSSRKNSSKTLLNSSLFVAVSMLIFLTLKSVTHQKRDTLHQKNELAIIKREIPEQSEVFLSRISPAYYYLGNFKSIKLNTIGFVFPEYFFPETIVPSMNKNAYLVLTEEYLDRYLPFSEQFEKRKVNFITQDIYIWKKK